MLAAVVNILEQTAIKPANPTPSFYEYFTGLFTNFMIIIGVLAVAMIVWGGLEYMFSQVPGIKVQAKERIWAAVWGLVLALAAVTILTTINPDIAKLPF